MSELEAGVVKEEGKDVGVDGQVVVVLEGRVYELPVGFVTSDFAGLHCLRAAHTLHLTGICYLVVISGLAPPSPSNRGRSHSTPTDSVAVAFITPCNLTLFSKQFLSQGAPFSC